MTQPIGVTGPNGFIAQWVLRRLRAECDATELPRAAWDNPAALDAFVSRCSAVVHLAGANRGADDEIESTIPLLAQRLVDACLRTGATPHVIYSSTTKRDDDTPYGRGKREAERILNGWAERSGAAVTNLVIPNVYGAGCRPFYNSVVATFCHQLAHGQTPTVTGDARLDLIWVGDLADRIAAVALGRAPRGARVAPITDVDSMRVNDLLATLEAFRDAYFARDVVPDITTRVRSRLYSTFLSHVELEDHVHRPPLHTDPRGALCELVKSDAGGQVFFSTTAPGVTRGNHYHTRKVEWFCVVRGEAVIRLRHVDSDRVESFRVSGDKPEFVSIPVLHTHSIENVGDSELMTVFWTNELFDPNDADTHPLNVLPADHRAVAA